MAGTAVVTGASRGIGRATTLELAKDGYRVFALARSGSDLQELAAAGGRTGMAVAPIVMDISNDASRQNAVAAIMQATKGYGADVLVNNAGYGQMGPLEEISAQQLRQQFEVNVVGLIAFMQPFLPLMRERRHGIIVNVSSVAGRMVTPFSGAYAASKAAVEAMSDALRLELSTFGVRVVLIEPGPIRTAFKEAARAMTPDPTTSPYARSIKHFEEGRKGWYLFEQPPEKVAHTIARAVRSDHPHARYAVTLPAKMTNVVRRLAPDALSDWAVRRVLHDRPR